MSIFGKLFDFNLDGKVDLGEELMGLSILSAMEDEEKAKKAREIQQQIDAGIDSDSAEMSKAELSDTLDELRDRLDELEDNEPDFFSDAHDSWDEAHDELEEMIDDLEGLLDD